MTLPDFDPSSTAFIVDDDPSIREAVANLLESVGIASETFASTEDFLNGWTSERRGCLVLDVRLPGMTGVEFQEKLARLDIHIPIIFMTAHADVPMVRKVMKAGAVEFLTKPFQKEELLCAIQQAFDDDHLWRQEQSTVQTVQARLDTLTPREREVMEMVIAGSLNKQIAAHLSLSEITVKLHRRRVMEKMEAGSLAELVRTVDRIRRTTGS